MGYRSNVRIIIDKKGYEKLEKFVKDYLKDKKLLETEYNLLEDCDLKKIDNEKCYLGWNAVKWYEGDYEDVDAIMKGLEFLAEEDVSYRFCRIGENYDDIEELYYDSSEGGRLEYPSISRDFDDYYIIDTMDIEENLDKNEIEI